MQPTFVLECLRWWAQVHFGLVIGSLQGAMRLASRTFPAPSPRLRTKLLTDTMQHLRLNENAPMQPLQRAANADKWLKG